MVRNGVSSENDRERESEIKYRELFETMREAFFICEVIRNEAGSPVDIRFMDANPACAATVLRRREEMIGHTYLELFPSSQTFLTWLDHFGQIAHTGNPQHFEQFSSSAGRYFDVFAYAYGSDQVAVLLNDITERKLAEQAEQIANAQLRFYTDSDLIGVVIGKEDGNLVEVNDYYLNLLGYTREEFNAGLLDWRNITPPEYIPADAQAILELKEHGICNPYEKEYFRKDGSRVWVYLRDALLPDGNLGAVVLDITDRKRAEKLVVTVHNDLISERSRLLSIMEALPIGLATYDINGGLIQSNSAFEAVWGSDRPKTLTVDDYELYKGWWVETGKQVQPEEWASARAVLHGETVTGQFIRIRKFDGTDGYVLNSGAPVRDALGQIIGATVAIMDITESVRAQKALQVSEERFRVALSSLTMTVYTMDRDLRYTWVYNPRNGLGVEEVNGKRDDELRPIEDIQELVAAKQLVIDTCQSVKKEIKVSLDGENRYFLLSLEPIQDMEGKVIGLIGASLDVTEQRRIENERHNAVMQMEVQRQLLENREKERQEIAHELHDGPIQLLAGTLFNLQMAKEVAEDPTIQLELDHATQNLKSAVRDLRETVNELRPPTIIRFGFSRAARMHAEDFQEKHPEIHIDFQMFDDGDRLPETVRAALFRIYQESLNNIIKHANARRIQVEFFLRNNQIHLLIQDDGQGFQVPVDMVRQTQRGHYGLAGMKERAEAVGGKFTVLSEAGKGTTTLVVVPVVEETE